ncbi:MAG: class I lanthipeptide [Bacteroidia bacterium]|nr:class I lanthipeptide [Bacteroidia bacterium]
MNKETIANLSNTQMSRINGGNGNDSGTWEYPDDLILDGAMVEGNDYYLEFDDGNVMTAAEAFTASISTCHISQFTCCTGAGCDCKKLKKRLGYFE